MGATHAALLLSLPRLPGVAGVVVRFSGGAVNDEPYRDNKSRIIPLVQPNPLYSKISSNSIAALKIKTSEVDT